MIKRILKIFLVFLVVIFVVLVSFLIAIQTRPFKSWLGDFVEKTANNKLNAELSIGRINGNFFTTLEILDTHVVFENDTLAVIPRIGIELAPKHLLHRKIVISSVVVDSPEFYIYQFPDSSWVFSNLYSPKVKDDTTALIEKDSTAFDWTIVLDEFQLLNLYAKIAAVDSLVPRNISNLNISLTGLFSPESKRLHLHNLAFQSVSPDFQVAALSFLLEQDEESVTLERFILQSGKNKLTAKAQAESKPMEGSASLDSSPLDLSEFQFILPSLSIKGNPRFNIKCEYAKDRLQATLNLDSQQSQLHISADINNIAYILGDSLIPEPQYTFKGALSNITLSDWAQGLQNNILLNGDFSIEGQGISAHSADARTLLRLKDCKVDGRIIESITADVRYNMGNVQTQLRYIGDMGSLDANARVSDIFSSQDFFVSLICRDLDLQVVLSDSTFASNINLDVQASGKSFDFEKLKSELELVIHPSRIYGTDIDTLYAGLALTKENIDIQSFSMHLASIDLNAHGVVGLDSSDLSFTLETGDLMALNHFVQADTINGTIRMNAHVNGSLDSLAFNSTIDGDSILYNGTTVDSLLFNVKGQRTNDKIFATAHSIISQIDLGAIIIEDIHLDTDLTPEHIDVKTSLRQGENIRARMNIRYLLNEQPIIFVKQLDIDLLDGQWRGGSENTSIVLGDGEYIVTDFHLKRINQDTSRAQVYIDGAVRFDGEENLKILIDNYNVAPLSDFLETRPNLGGTFNLSLHLTGTAEHPILDLDTQISDIQYNDYSLKKLSGTVGYENEKINAQVALVPRTDSLFVESVLPASFSLRDRSFNLFKDKPFNLKVFSNHVPLQNIVPENNITDKVAGLLNIDIQASNTLSNIIPSGSISLKDGALSIDEIGAAIDKIDMNISIKQESLVLDHFHATRDNGWLDINGYATLDSSIFSGILKAIHLDLRAHDFYLSTKPEHEIQIASNIQIGGALNSLRYDGELEILRSSFDLDYFLKKAGKQSQVREMPLLVQAYSNMTMDTLLLDTTVTITAKKEAPDILKSLRGRLEVKVPRNTWIRNNNMRVEIGGDVDIIKNSENFWVFGPIEILRGQFDIMARRFRLTEGTIRFLGREKIDPMLNVRAEYTFRDSKRDNRTIILDVTDQASQPTISFTLDNTPITEWEAISYILFNRSPEEVGGAPSASGSNLATDLVYGMMSAEISRRFGQQLGVDYIEIKGEHNLNTATFVVGKFITPDLFMSYEHSLGAMEEDHPPQVVTVEYELTKYIFLQLISGDTKSTGAALLFKFDK